MLKHKGHENVGRKDQGVRLKEKYGPDYYRNIARMRTPGNVQLTAILGGFGLARKIANDPSYVPSFRKQRKPQHATNTIPHIITCTCGRTHAVPEHATCITCVCSRDIWYTP